MTKTECRIKSEWRNPEGVGDCITLHHSGFDIPSSFDIRALSFVSFVAERFDGIERGGFARWIKAEENADGCAE